MTGLSDAAVARLRTAASWPAFTSDRYEVVESIGRGGMGTVYLAVDRALGREVAIKVPHAATSTELEARLHVEARVLAQLEHPGIVPIHDVGRLADGRLFSVMKRVRGLTLQQHLQNVPDLNERLRVFERICEPVAFAHARGLIHRDLKPDNIMVGAFGEVMVMDWGVAKLLFPDAGQAGPRPEPAAEQALEQPHGSAMSAMTHPGTIVGTRGFMAPEQAVGASESIDARADVYGLGAILFLLLTGGPPRESNSAGEISRYRGLPRPLTAICARALAVRPDDRYPSVTALADDVAAFRAGRAVSAYKETLLERAGRFGRTYRTAILLVLAYVLMRVIIALSGVRG